MPIPGLRFLFARRGERWSTLCGLLCRSLWAEGPLATWRRLRSYARTVTAAADTPLPPTSTRKNVLFVAGCPGHPRRWRCEHELERLAIAGITGDLIDHPAADLSDYLGCYDRFVLQRVPHDPSLERFVHAARAAGKRVTVDIDDLVIHERYGPELPILRDYTPLARELYVQQLRRIGMVLALASDCTVATPALAAEVAACFPQLPVAVVPNRASGAMVAAAGAAMHVQTAPETVVFGYFAGTRTHQHDLATIVVPLAALLDAEPRARLLLVGDVDLPPELARFAARIDRRPAVPWQQLPALQRAADVHLVPLVPSKFTACKSELKWVEAALVGRPVIAAAVGPYRDCIRDGENGLLCADAAQWSIALRRVLDPALRERLGAAARLDVLAGWTTASGPR